MAQKKSFVQQIGGAFIYSKEPGKLADWYKDTLDIKYEKAEGFVCYYFSFYYNELDSGKKAYIVWSILENKNRPDLKEKVFCINYRVADLDKKVTEFRKKKIEVKGVETYPEGKFAWITDPDGNTVELWEDTNIK